MAEVETESESKSNTFAQSLRRLAAETRSNRGLVTIALLLAMTVSSLEQTVVSTAMPTIIASLHGLDIYPWVFSAYLLAATVTTPLYGKLADLMGRKRVLLFGLGLFALGSVLSGLAQSMPQLIAMRVLQGLGAGAVGPIVITMLGDLFTLEERRKIQGLFSIVWGTSSLAGPALGGVITDYLSWRWVFFVTVPFALVSSWILITHVHEKIEKRAVKPIDWSGAGLLTAGSTLLLLTVLRGGGQSWQAGIAIFAASIGVFGLFLWNERRAADPVLPIDLIFTRHIGAAIGGSFLIGRIGFRDRYLRSAVRARRAGRIGDGLRAHDHAAVSRVGDERRGCRAGRGAVGIPPDGRRRLADRAVGNAGPQPGRGVSGAIDAVFHHRSLVDRFRDGSGIIKPDSGGAECGRLEPPGAATASVMFFRTMGGADGRRVGGVAWLGIGAPAGEHQGDRCRCRLAS